MSGKRIPTGVPELDALIEGGLRQGKSYLVVGDPGTGKSVLSLQYLVRGLMDKEKGLYVAIDEKPADVIEQAASLGWDLAPFIESKEFLILDASAYFVARAGDTSKSVDVQRVATDLNTYITRMGAARVVIDPVGPLVGSRNPDQARQLIYALQANTNTTHLLTTYSSDKQLRGVEEYLVAGTIALSMEPVNGRFMRRLTIEKMRGTALEPAQYPFSIVGNIGASLQTLFGGNITIYTELCGKARDDAHRLMVEHAGQLGANAIIGVRYDATEIAAGATEVLAYGTAVYAEVARG